MRKKMFVLTLIVLLLLGSVSSVLAHPSIKLFLNGEEIKTDVPPENIKGRVLVPIRVLTERLGAFINWNEKRNSVDIDFKKEQTREETHITLLERALAPKEPFDAAKSWAEGVKTRNGALQYAVMSPELKKAHYAGFSEANWSTGTSSPWVDSYSVTEKCRVDDQTYRFAVEFTYTDSTKSTFTTSEYITVRNFTGDWLLSAIEKIAVKGKITKVTFDNNKKLKSIFVEDDAVTRKGYDRANVLLAGGTKIYDGYTERELTERVLDKGASVEVVFTDDPVATIYPVTAVAKIIRVMDSAKKETVIYGNDHYGFSFSLPETWQGYTIVSDKWEGLSLERSKGSKVVETGPIISIRHPRWTPGDPRQDIPIMIFTPAQWDLLQREKFHIGAAPIGPKEIARNSKYVFALPARYNFAFPTGYEEVEKILEGDPLRPY